MLPPGPFVPSLLLPCRAPAAAAAQVCKRWNAVVYSNKCVELWRHQSSKLGGPSNFPFARVSTLIETWHMPARSDKQCRQAAADMVPALLRVLSPHQLTGLALDHVPLTTAGVHVLSQPRQLRGLALLIDGPVPRHRGNLAAAVGQLPHLETFMFRGNSVHPSLAAALSVLPRLAHLELHSVHRPLPSLECLTALSGRLTTPDLVERTSSDTGLVLPLAASFPKLATLRVGAPKLQV